MHLEPIHALQSSMRSGKYDLINTTKLNLGIVRNTPLRIVKSEISFWGNPYAECFSAAMHFIDRHRPEPSVTQVEMDNLSTTWLVICDGKLVHFLRMDAVSLLAEKTVYDFEKSDFCCGMTGVVDDELVEKHHGLLIFMFAMVEAMRWSPDDKLMSVDPPFQTLIAGRRVAVGAVSRFTLPDDVKFLTGVANRAPANKEEIERMNVAYTRTTLSVENGLARSGYKITCCRCGHEDSIIASGHTGSLPQTAINKKFQQRGWKTGRKAVGPCCLAPKPAKFPTPQTPETIDMKPTLVQPVAIEPPRQMTAADRRKVFRAIDDQWDEAKSRYLGAASDSHIAQTLDVPRAWVTEVREENFGKTQRNEDLDKIAGELKNLRADAARHVASALDLSYKFEELEKRYIELQRRVEAVE